MTRNEFEALLKRAGLNKKEFSRLSKMSYSTVTQWGTAKNGRTIPTPEWIKSWIEYYIKAQYWDEMTQKMLEKNPIDNTPPIDRP